MKQQRWFAPTSRRPNRVRRTRARILPLMLAAAASQSLLVVLAPSIVAVSTDLGATVGQVGQARSITAGVALTGSIALVHRIEAIGVPRLIRLGAILALAGCAGVAAAPSLPVYLAAHVLIGLAFAGLLSAGFAGVAAYAPERRSWGMGYVAASNGLAWVVVNPLAGLLTAETSWRVAQLLPAMVAGAALTLAHTAAPVPSGPPARARDANASARRWVVAETLAYSAWAALLTYVGALLIEELDVPTSVAGWLLAAGAASFVAASTASRLVRVPRRVTVATASLVMAGLVPVLTMTASWVTASVAFCAIGFVAGVRTPVSGALGLEQMAGHPATMMAARTGAVETGYLIGAIVGGAIIAVAGYAVLGPVLTVVLTVSGLMMLSVGIARSR